MVESGLESRVDKKIQGIQGWMDWTDRQAGLGRMERTERCQNKFRIY